MIKFEQSVAGPRLQPHFYGGTMEICLDKLQIMIDIQMTMFGFNYKTLGLAVGVHPSYLRDIPSGKRVATESTAGNLVKFFGEQILK